MDANVGSNVSFSRLAGTAFGLGTQISFAFTVCLLFLFLRDGSNVPANNWLALDCLLALQFGVVHSILLLPSVRAVLSRILPSQLYGSFFCAATCLGLWLVFVYWRGSSTLFWNATGFTRLAVWAGFYASWVALFFSLRLSGLGYQTGWTQWMYWLRRQSLPPRGFKERGAYRWLRHPVYLSFLGLIWFAPRMTADHAVLCGVWTAYVFVGSYLKDRRLAYYLGDPYREYASRVPGYPGMFFGPLGKWPKPDSSWPIANVGVETARCRAA
jgi:protein-S-isoprenylcysteine O-methyltransferase Ste14